MLYQLVYGSASTVDFDEEALLELLRVARVNNAKVGVTGMLLYAEGSFMQVLEGEREVVESLFNKIERDARHFETRVLLKVEVEERSFGDWSMGFIHTLKLSELPPGLSLFMRQGASGKEDIDSALKALSGFRDGRWRRAV